MATLPRWASVVADEAGTQGHTFGNTTMQTQTVNWPDSIASVTAAEANGINKSEVVPRCRWQRRKIGHCILRKAIVTHTTEMSRTTL
jgi:hypothetical protein